MYPDILYTGIPMNPVIPYTGSPMNPVIPYTGSHMNPVIPYTGSHMNPVIPYTGSPMKPLHIHILQVNSCLASSTAFVQGDFWASPQLPLIRALNVQHCNV